MFLIFSTTVRVTSLHSSQSRSEPSSTPEPSLPYPSTCSLLPHHPSLLVFHPSAYPPRVLSDCLFCLNSLLSASLTTQLLLIDSCPTGLLGAQRSGGVLHFILLLVTSPQLLPHTANFLQAETKAFLFKK